jgi:hypothetical protein
MKHNQRFNMLRAKYRSLWDAHQIIADTSARLAKTGKHPSNEQLINEQPFGVSGMAAPACRA